MYEPIYVVATYTHQFCSLWLQLFPLLLITQIDQLFKVLNLI